MDCFMQRCRLCSSDKNVLFTIHNLDSDGKYFIDKLEATVPKIVDCNLKLPNGICTVCVIQLNDAYTFIKQCSDTQIILRQRQLNKQLCRLCASNENISLTLTSMDSDNILISYKLEIIASKLLEFNEKLPESICLKCSIRLNKTYKFVEKCFKSHEVFKHYAKQQLQNNIVMKTDEMVKDDPVNSLNNEENIINFETVYIKKENIDEETDIIGLGSEDLDLHSGLKIKKENSDLENETDTKMCCTSTNINENIISNSEENDNSVKKRNSHKCTLCEKLFSTSACLNVHIRRIHTKRKQYICKICNIAFIEKIQLKIHKITHAREKKLYKCDLCEKTFNKSGNLKAHIRSHTQERPFKCEICEKAFNENGNLKKHFRTHTQERPYKCEMCEKAFTESGNLKKHIRSHTQERPYTCDLCEKAFTASGHLKNHIRSHTQERPYKCQMCEKAFNESGHLKRHIRSKHTNK